MQERWSRQREQLNEIRSVAALCKKIGVEICFFKTFRPFTYIPDDVDIILRNPLAQNILVQALLQNSYRLRNIGTAEVTIRKILNGTFVDLDIHTAAAAGHLQLLHTDSIWRNVVDKRLKDGSVIPVLNTRYEVVNAAGYALLKDFTVTIPTLYLANYAMLYEDLRLLEDIAEKEGLAVPLKILFGTAARMNMILSRGRKELGGTSELVRSSFYNGFPMSLIDADLQRGLTLPYPFPIMVVAYAYLDKARSELRTHNTGVLIQLAKQPSSKGLEILMDYVAHLASRRVRC
jgi:hypothetical protein